MAPHRAARQLRAQRSGPQLERRGKGRERADDVFFCLWHKKTSEQSGLCSDVEGTVKIDIFERLTSHQYSTIIFLLL